MPPVLRLLATRSVRALALPALLLATFAGPVLAASYPPQIPPPDPNAVKSPGVVSPAGGPIFTNVHSYAYGPDPTAVVIRVDVFNNYLGDFGKYQWVYTVTNNTYEPVPGTSNGFSGFELALPVFVPDIGDITAPDGIGPWLINCCSGQPVEWDLTNSAGAPVAGGTLPGQTEVYSFTTLPRLITISTGWFHTWQTDVQTDIVNYPPGDGPEVPDLISEPNQELCCRQDSTGAWICGPLPVGQCAAIGGIIVPNCDRCPPVTPARSTSWGSVKGTYR
jgi:hypothetical protein